MGTLSPLAEPFILTQYWDALDDNAYQDSNHAGKVFCAIASESFAVIVAGESLTLAGVPTFLVCYCWIVNPVTGTIISKTTLPHAVNAAALYVIDASTIAVATTTSTGSANGTITLAKAHADGTLTIVQSGIAQTGLFNGSLYRSATSEFIIGLRAGTGTFNVTTLRWNTAADTYVIGPAYHHTPDTADSIGYVIDDAGYYGGRAASSGFGGLVDATTLTTVLESWTDTYGAPQSVAAGADVGLVQYQTSVSPKHSIWRLIQGGHSVYGPFNPVIQDDANYYPWNQHGRATGVVLSGGYGAGDTARSRAPFPDTTPTGYSAWVYAIDGVAADVSQDVFYVPMPSAAPPLDFDYSDNIAHDINYYTATPHVYGDLVMVVAEFSSFYQDDVAGTFGGGLTIGWRTYSLAGPPPTISITRSGVHFVRQRPL